MGVVRCPRLLTKGLFCFVFLKTRFLSVTVLGVLELDLELAQSGLELTEIHLALPLLGLKASLLPGTPTKALKRTIWKKARFLEGSRCSQG